jgi:RNA polymerase sigma-70 factor (ECF subfamily)
LTPARSVGIKDAGGRIVNGPDVQRISRAQAGDSEALEALYHSHVGRVRAYFARCGFRPPDDPAQEVFLRAMRSLGTYDPARGSFGGWLAAIARNVARRQWRRREPPANFDPDLAEDVLVAADDPGDAPEAREEIAAVRACVDELPDELARLVGLRYVEGRTTRGVAAAAGLAESTVRRRLEQARGLLRRCLKGKGFLS